MPTGLLVRQEKGDEKLVGGVSMLSGYFDSFTYFGKELGEEISDDTIFTVGMQNFHFQNVEKFLRISHETIFELQKPRCIASSCQDILIEYFMEHEWLDAVVDGRMTIEGN